MGASKRTHPERRDHSESQRLSPDPELDRVWSDQYRVALALHAGEKRKEAEWTN